MNEDDPRWDEIRQEQHALENIRADLDRQKNKRSMLNWWIKRAMADEECFVKDHQRARRLAGRTPLKFVAGIVAVLIANYLVGWSLALIWVNGVYGLITATWASSALRRAHAFRDGWVDGRVEMMQALHQADRAGVPVEVFIQQQMIKDMEGVVW